MSRFLWAVTLFIFILYVFAAVMEFGSVVFGGDHIFLERDMLNGIGSMIAATYFGFLLIELGKV